MNFNKHRFLLSQLLLDIFNDVRLSSLLAFKGGTSLMMFYGLNRFSTDLDFNLLDETQMEFVHKILRGILLKYGTIDDEAIKFYGSILVLNYGVGERKLKVEVSVRQYDIHYEKTSMLNTDMNVMTVPDMFAHKLCALGERVTPRDIFDVWFFLSKRCEVNENIVSLRTGKNIAQYIMDMADEVSGYSQKILMQGIGEVLQDSSSKTFVKNRLLSETSTLLNLFALNPLVSTQPKTVRFKIIESNPSINEFCAKNDIDISIISEKKLLLLSNGTPISVLNKAGSNITVPCSVIINS
ncbi:MAG: nucleotidyl transferase AbiEii/AbiGii toxin family protein [Paludibacteraceae bacterium]|nr:nucleotidyl transferase AbiEii/AbiGii toxin family protein [Paludibacteraceae bacterium]